MKAFSSETALAAHVVGWLLADGWVVYQEVHDGNATCDVVATRGPILWAIETKLQFGTAVLGQAHRWTGRANLVSVATPRSRPSWVLLDVCKRYGIGWLEVAAPKWPGDPSVVSAIDPLLARLPKHEPHGLRRFLHPAQLDGPPAGSYGGGYHTPFKTTCGLVAQKVREKPGISLKECLTGLAHHYTTTASARAGIGYWAERGKVPGVVIKREGRHIRLYPEPKGA